MSYSAQINFKIVKEGELYGFLKQIKDACKEKIDEIAEDEFIYMPSIKNDYMLKNDSDWAKEQLDRGWMRNSVFSYRFFLYTRTQFTWRVWCSQCGKRHF
ncbi:MAG: hypothetical protein IJ445_06955 [Clostridia bacterium]|nr:hypothetical protein [Clostridia bacterium]